MGLGYCYLDLKSEKRIYEIKPHLNLVKSKASC